MKNIKLKVMQIENFKGIRKIAVPFSDTTRISGRNASGKTSIMDAFLWLLFGKDSLGRADFRVRPVDGHGNDIDNIDISVEATLAVCDEDGNEIEEIVLKKVQKQNWVKKRGTEVATFSGNVNSYEINGFPASQKEFDARVSSLVAETLFKILADPRAFANMKWQDQREILLRFVSAVTDQDILDGAGDTYALVADDILAAGADKAREKAAKILRELNAQQKDYPVRIDEAAKSIVAVDDADGIGAKRADLEDQLKDIETARNTASAALKAVSDIQTAIVNTKLQMADLERQETQKAANARYLSQKAYDDASAAVRDLTSRYNRTMDSINFMVATKASEEKAIAELVREYKSVKATTLPETETVCPTCGREYEPEQIESIKASFDMRKRERLNAISERGKTLRSEVDAAEGRIEAARKTAEELKAQCEEAMQNLDAQKAVLDSTPATADLSKNPEYASLERSLAELNGKLTDASSADTGRQKLDAAEASIKEQLRELDAQVAVIAANERAKLRIEELKAEQMSCSQKVADQEHRLYLIEEFVKAKMGMLSERINSHFKYVRFRLFDHLINGAVKDTCVMQLASNGSWVDYGSANNAARILGGLDVIDALSELYDVTVPIFLDNSECLNPDNIPEMKAQMVLLEVTDDDQLIVEI